MNEKVAIKATGRGGIAFAPLGEAPAPPNADGRDSRWENHRAKRRRHLISSARRAIAARGLDTSMDDIALASGTSKSVIYRYFGDREGLQQAISHAVVDETYRKLRDAVDNASAPQDALFEMVNVYLSMVEKSPQVYRFITQSGESTALVARFSEVAADLLSGPLEPFFDEQQSQAGGSTMAWSVGAIGFIRGTGDWWLASPPESRASRRDLARYITQWLWQGFATPVTPAPTSTHQ